MDRARPKKGSNNDWTHPHDPDARITKMKDGRTHLAHKTEHAVDVDTGAVIALTVQGADEGDTTTMTDTVITAAEQIETVQPAAEAVRELIADKGYYSNERSSTVRPAPAAQCLGLAELRLADNAATRQRFRRIEGGLARAA